MRQVAFGRLHQSAYHRFEPGGHSMSLDQLTTRQREVLDFIREKIRGRGYGPTVREIGEEFDILSPNGVMCHLKALEKKGLITREPNMSRAITLTDAARQDEGFALVGQIAAGGLAEAIEQADRLNLEEYLPAKKNTFALAHKGDIVVAMTEEGEATLKYWYPEANRIRLQPANSSMKPIYVKDAQVLGVVTGVIRKI
jgi:repressor LexA